MASSSSSDATAKVYACPVCAREFNKKANLKVHSRKHTGEKPYACSRPGCDRRFMWKSSVSFHEQNCMPTRREPESGVQSVPKRHKVIHNGGNGTRAERRMHTTPITPGESPPRTHVTNVQNPAVIPVQSATLPSPLDYHQRSAEIARNASHNSSARPQNGAMHHHLARQHIGQMPAHPSMSMQHSSNFAQYAGPQFSVSGLPGSTGLDSTGRSSPLMRNMQLSEGQHAAQFQGNPAVHNGQAGVYQGTAAHATQNKQVTSPYSTESQPLPAPSTILEKRMPSAGRPPVIPASLPKPFYGTKQNLGTIDQNANAQKNVFDNKLPATLSSAAKPPVMHGSKMFKMPISMELDDSDDEGAERIIGAQDAFMRTGNIFAGFAPPTRCSPLPASSPIVCPGVVPMPLSPLAPFSPLPPDSPAHNAPNPVHPPLNQPQRSLNSNY